MSEISAELISIGNELLAGYTVNTNVTFISQQLKDIGISVKWITTIADEPDEIFDALQKANQRANIVMTTGGLGQTPDDITKATICTYFDTKLHQSHSVLKDLKKFIHDRNRSEKFLEINRGQALVPVDAQIISNPIGTAPGLILKRDGSWFSFMPGVPREMKAMVTNHFIPFLKTKFDLPKIKTEIMRTTGVPESKLYDILKAEIEAYPQFPVAFLPKQIGVDMRFRLMVTDSGIEKNWHGFIERIRIKAQKYIFTNDERNIEQVMVEMLSSKKLTLAIVESFTGGLIQDWITDVPGSSAIYNGGIVTYSNESKVEFTEVSQETLQKFGAVSEQTALEMVRGIQKRFNSDCAISTTGIAGPDGGSKEKPVGLCFVAARYKEKEFVRQFNFGTERRINKMRGAMTGMEMLRRLLV
ncbi:MAG: competence/damage-inducible protein A [Calditrichaeota bacterium]|nr:MAG: competence/damage-inducible protein A [Calditrichota bacterium]MBL1206835.1 competence/damage-inducible protein A [Calditrichota bacterium]NOG46662.1 competence/damage-inducible protein A [Calditrichota bacterium]